MLPHLLRAGDWFARSGIQAPTGGVARFYRTDLARNNSISTEITGYAASAFVYLHSLTGDPIYLDRAAAAARFLSRTAWDPALGLMPFELDPARFSYFFDSGIVVRGVLSVWRAAGDGEFRDVAIQLGRRMAEGFACDGADFHPVLCLPDCRPLERDPTRWSLSSGAYQLKAGMAWWDLFEATGDANFAELYDRILNLSLRDAPNFLPGDPNPLKVMDRLHAFLYFLEGLLPRAAEPRCAAALDEGISRVEGLLWEIAPTFVRSDVVAQLLRIRLFADCSGAVPLDLTAARREAAVLADFQASSPDPRMDGGFYFGRKGAEWLPYINPVSTAFALQALALWECYSHGVRPQRPLLI